MKYFSGFRPVGWLVAAAISFLLACSGLGIPEDQVFTLYRNVPSTPDFRFHVATFDADYGDAEMSKLINSTNCSRSQTLFQDSKEWEGVRFWCEKGRFKK